METVKKMMQRDEEGYIISKLPETAVYLEGLENLVIPFKGGFPEYTPDAYNRVNRYFRKLKMNFDIDNLNNEEWTNLTSEYEKLELNGIEMSWIFRISVAIKKQKF